MDPTCSKGNKIKRWGCGLIALNFALNAVGQNFDPIELNSLLNILFDDYSPTTPGDPCSGGKINWSSAVKEVSGGTLAFLDKRSTGQSNSNALDEDLCSPQPHPVIIKVRNGDDYHFVVVTGKVGNTYSIVDPGYRNKTRLSDWGIGGSPPQFSVYGVVKRRNESLAQLNVY